MSAAAETRSTFTRPAKQPPNHHTPSPAAPHTPATPHQSSALLPLYHPTIPDDLVHHHQTHHHYPPPHRRLRTNPASHLSLGRSLHPFSLVSRLPFHASPPPPPPSTTLPTH